MVAARHQPETPCRSSAIGIDLVDERAQDILGLRVFDLAGAGRVVAATAVLQHQLAHVGLAAAVQAVTNNNHRRLTCSRHKRNQNFL